MRLNIEKRKNPFGGNPAAAGSSLAFMQSGHKDILQLNSGTGFVKYIPTKSKSQFGTQPQ